MISSQGKYSFNYERKVIVNYIIIALIVNVVTMLQGMVE